MRFVLGALSLAFIAATPGPAHADMELLRKKNCFACHGIDKRKDGPTFAEIAAKYVGDSGAVERLAKRIQVGGSGVWGEGLMPPQPQVSDADAVVLAKFVLSLK